MAQSSTGNARGLPDKRVGRGGPTTPESSSFHSNTKDVASMRNRLKAISSSTYTDSVLDKMTENDMIYAIQRNDEAGAR